MPVLTTGQLRFMASNLLKTGTVSITSSYINPTYPLSNLTTDFRGRHTKFNGSFTIDSTNNKIYINDGTNKTATLASATYTSRSAFATQVQTQLNAVSSDFTVTWNSTLKSFIISRLSNFTLRLTQTTNAAWTTLGYSGSSDLSGDDSYTADLRRFHWPYEFIKVDFGYFPNVGFLGIISDSRELFQISEMATVKIQANTIDDFTSPPLDRTLTVTEKGIMSFFDDDDYNYRYWRLLITDNNNDDDPEIGYMYLGEFSTFNDRDNNNPTYNNQRASVREDDLSESTQSESGQMYSLERQLQKVCDDIEFQLIDAENKDYLLDIWRRFKKVRPFFISIDPKLEITENIEDSTFFCSFIDRPRFTHIFRNLYDTSFGVKEWL